MDGLDALIEYDYNGNEKESMGSKNDRQIAVFEKRIDMYRNLWLVGLRQSSVEVMSVNDNLVRTLIEIMYDLGLYSQFDVDVAMSHFEEFKSYHREQFYYGSCIE